MFKASIYFKEKKNHSKSFEQEWLLRNTVCLYLESVLNFIITFKRINLSSTIYNFIFIWLRKYFLTIHIDSISTAIHCSTNHGFNEMHTIFEETQRKYSKNFYWVSFYQFYLLMCWKMTYFFFFLKTMYNISDHYSIYCS